MITIADAFISWRPYPTGEISVESESCQLLFNLGERLGKKAGYNFDVRRVGEKYRAEIALYDLAKLFTELAK